MKILLGISSVAEVHWLQSFFNRIDINDNFDVLVDSKSLAAIDSSLFDSFLNSIHAKTIPLSRCRRIARLERLANHLIPRLPRNLFLRIYFYKLVCFLSSILVSSRLREERSQLPDYDYIFFSNSCPFNANLEALISLNVHAQTVIYPHAQAIFSSYSYPNLKPVRRYNYWLEPSFLSDWSLSCDKDKTFL